VNCPRNSRTGGTGDDQASNFFAIIVVSSLPGCDDWNNGRIENIVLNHYQMECYTLFPNLCLLRQAGKTDDWQLSYDRYKGLDYEGSSLPPGSHG
jgi:hypothetical protein